MQPTKYEMGLLVARDPGSSATGSPLSATLGPRASAERNSKFWCPAKRLPLGPKTSTCSLVYGQSHDAWRMAVASGYSSTIVASSSTSLCCSTLSFLVEAYTRAGRPFSHNDRSAP